MGRILFCERWSSAELIEKLARPAARELRLTELLERAHVIARKPFAAIPSAMVVGDRRGETQAAVACPPQPLSRIDSHLSLIVKLWAATVADTHEEIRDAAGAAALRPVVAARRPAVAVADGPRAVQAGAARSAFEV